MPSILSKMAPVANNNNNNNNNTNNIRRTGTVPKTKTVKKNSVPQEMVVPTRRDLQQQINVSIFNKNILKFGRPDRKKKL